MSLRANKVSEAISKRKNYGVYSNSVLRLLCQHSVPPRNDNERNAIRDND